MPIFTFRAISPTSAFTTLPTFLAPVLYNAGPDGEEVLTLVEADLPVWLWGRNEGNREEK